MQQILQRATLCRVAAILCLLSVCDASDERLEPNRENPLWVLYAVWLIIALVNGGVLVLCLYKEYHFALPQHAVEIRATVLDYEFDLSRQLDRVQLTYVYQETTYQVWDANYSNVRTGDYVNIQIDPYRPRRFVWQDYDRKSNWKSGLACTTTFGIIFTSFGYLIVSLIDSKGAQITFYVLFGVFYGVPISLGWCLYAREWRNAASGRRLVSETANQEEV